MRLMMIYIYIYIWLNQVNELLRHSSMPLVSGLLTDLRSHGIFTFFAT